MTNVATRLITLILTLQRQPGQKAADLAEKLGISVRTLHRYFAMLDEMGVPVYAERGRPDHARHVPMDEQKHPDGLPERQHRRALCLGAQGRQKDIQTLTSTKRKFSVASVS